MIASRRSSSEPVVGCIAFSIVGLALSSFHWTVTCLGLGIGPGGVPRQCRFQFSWYIDTSMLIGSPALIRQSPPLFGSSGPSSILLSIARLLSWLVSGSQVILLPLVPMAISSPLFGVTRLPSWSSWV